jgi:hypothetical protein
VSRPPQQESYDAARSQSSAQASPLMPLPPSLSGTPPMGSSPMSVPTGSPGAQAGAMAKVREAINILQQVLPSIPLGSEPHKAIMSAISGMSKYIPPSAEVPGVQQTALRDLQKNAGQNAMLQQVMGSLGAGGSQQQGAAPMAAPNQ